MPPPADPKIYHIVHADRLASILADGHLWCDAEVDRRSCPGTTAGMGHIKRRRQGLPVASHPGLRVGDCVPFYFCPRSIMLYILHKANHVDLAYRGGQGPIVHLEADLHRTVAWAEEAGLRWAFTLSNAGSRVFEDRCDLGQLDEIDWQAVAARDWQKCKDGKQAEFLVEGRFPWALVDRIGVHSRRVHGNVLNLLGGEAHRPPVEVLPAWYY